MASPMLQLDNIPTTRGYQQEMLQESIHHNIIIAMDTGSGKTLIAVLRIKYEVEREPSKVAWFFAPTVALCRQQKAVIQTYLPVSVGLVSGELEPDQWKSASLWQRVLTTHRAIVSTPQVFLDALRHGYIDLGKDISLLVFDEAHHAADNHPYNRIMFEFYHKIPYRPKSDIIYGVSQVNRPCILGLTASPIYGGDVAKAFQTLESNLDSIIRAPSLNRLELAQFVHRPVFQHIMYHGWTVLPFSTNFAAVSGIIDSLKIEHDPYVVDLRKRLDAAQPGSLDYIRIDQKLSTTLRSQKTFTLKGLRDFKRAADDILHDIGSWAADWYVWQVLEKAREAANPFNNIMNTWKTSEKAHLLRILDQVTLSPVSFHPEDIMDDCSDKVNQLITVLLNEHVETEKRGEVYSGLIFVQRRDSVLALAEVLTHHPFTSDIFRIGVLLGTSDSQHRHSFLDITRRLARDTQDTMDGFKSGELNLIVATAVAEEGIDIQACGSVIRWDPPNNMASWAQSRGRARKQKSTFTLMFQHGSSSQNDVAKWEDLERRMVEMYNDPLRDFALSLELTSTSTPEDDIEGNDMMFIVESTGAQLSLHSAVAHISHFCAVIPSTAHVDNRPIYDVFPPDIPLGWHSVPSSQVPIYNGPWGCKLTLPRCLPLSCREFSVEMIYQSKTSAHRHVAFEAYVGLYKAGLLNENLLPFTSVIEPDLEEDVKEMLKDVEKRVGMASVDLQMDPWAAGPHAEEDDRSSYWWMARVCIGDLPPLILFMRSEPVELGFTDGPVLHRPGLEKPIRVSVTPIGRVHQDEAIMGKAKIYTRRVFWSLNWARMEWDNLDLAYLFYPETIADEEEDVWAKRRVWLEELNRDKELKNHDREYVANARAFGEAFGYTVDHSDDPIIVLKEFGRPYRFAGWRYERLSEEEEKEISKGRQRTDWEQFTVKYPLLVAKPFHARRNFLVPINTADPLASPPEVKHIYLFPEFSGIILISPVEVDYALLIPSVLRSIGMTMTMTDLSATLFSSCPSLRTIPRALLMTAMTAPSAGERFNYQRLETLGDTVLKFSVGLQVLVEYPLWHEGYLTKKKDHTVSNVRLAKEDLKRGVFRWILRDSMLGRKWKPKYAVKFDASQLDEEMSVAQDSLPSQNQPEEKLETEQQKDEKKKKKKKGKGQELSTKVLADVVESLIGAAYLHGSFDLGYECVKLFDLGLKWSPPRQRIEQFLARLEPDVRIPPALAFVEQMIGYTFRHKILLLEALTHASYQQDLQTVSYERMEFLGDSVLDMIVTDYLYHAPGRNYSPGHIHLRRSAVVNTHLLAYICMKTSLRFDATLPRTVGGQVLMEADAQEITLWQCLLHSSSRVMDDQSNTYSRFLKRGEEIETALSNDPVFPWAALTRLQAPKFFSDIIEAVIGAIFLDSEGDIATARSVVTHLGIMPVLERIVKDDVDVWHPVSRLSQWAQKNERELEFKFERERGAVKCSVLVDGKVEAEAREEYRGTTSQEEVKLVAAERAGRALKLRLTYMDQSNKGRGRGKRAPKKAQKEKQRETTGVNEDPTQVSRQGEAIEVDP